MSTSALDLLNNRTRGGIVRPGDEAYESARRIWNGMTDRRPAAIVRCTGTADVTAAVRYAREEGLPIAVRGGGHNVAGNAVCDDGIVIDLSGMRSVRVAGNKSVVRVGGGALLGDVDHETQQFGLATPLGAVSKTGVGGLSLHGGMGFLTRKYGLSADNLVSADVVTADGEVLIASEREHPDLWWALRGGGGNFGVVTSFEFALHPVGPEVFFLLTLYPASAGPAVLEFLADFMPHAPDELMAIAIYWSAPEEEPIPPEHRGAPVIVVVGCWCGPLDMGNEITLPLRQIDRPVADLSGPTPYVEMQQVFDRDYPNGRRYYWKSIYLNELSDGVIRLLDDAARHRPSPLSSVDVWSLGGAAGRVAPDATAFFHRDAPYLLGIEANWEGEHADAENIQWARQLFEDAKQFSTGGAYFNFPGFLEEGEALLEQSFGTNYARLKQVKQKYDPQNLFQYNLKIPV